MKERIETLRKWALFTVGIMLAVCVFLRADELKKTLPATLFTCINTLLPPLFPMMTASGILSAVGLPQPADRFVSGVLRKTLGVYPPLCTEFLFGQIGGYPVGIRSCAEKLRRDPPGRIPQSTVLTAVNPGPAFSVLTVGKSLFGSVRLGWAFYAAVTAANLTVAAILSLFSKDRVPTVSDSGGRDAAGKNVLIPAVDGAITGCAAVVAWILFFRVVSSALLPVMTNFPFLRAILEITDAAENAAANGSPILCAFSLGFGGICLLLQLYPAMHEIGIPLPAYAAVRLLCGGLSAAYFTLLLHLFPAALAVSALAPGRAALSRAGIPGVISFLLCCILFIVGAAPGNDEKKIRRNSRFHLKEKDKYDIIIKSKGGIGYGESHF